MANLTLIGMYNYDSTLFESMILPDGINKDLVIDAILEKSGEFETLYPDLDFIKMKIGTWFQRHYRTFDKWKTALNIEYNPLENYDRIEHYEDNADSTPAIGTGTTENQVSAYDSSTYQPSNKSTVTNTVTSPATNHVVHNARLHGNIGVTTSQQMLQSELDIARFNLYDNIADLFIEDFCIMIY